MPETTFKIAKYVQKSFSLVVHHLIIFGPRPWLERFYKIERVRP